MKVTRMNPMSILVNKFFTTELEILKNSILKLVSSPSPQNVYLVNTLKYFPLDFGGSTFRFENFSYNNLIDICPCKFYIKKYFQNYKINIDFEP